MFDHVSIFCSTLLLLCFVKQALFTRDDDTSDEEEDDDTESPDMIAADELQSGGASKQR